MFPWAYATGMMWAFAYIVDKLTDLHGFWVWLLTIISLLLTAAIVYTIAKTIFIVISTSIIGLLARVSPNKNFGFYSSLVVIIISTLYYVWQVWLFPPYYTTWVIVGVIVIDCYLISFAFMLWEALVKSLFPKEEEAEI